MFRALSEDALERLETEVHSGSASGGTLWAFRERRDRTEYMGTSSFELFRQKQELEETPILDENTNC